MLLSALNTAPEEASADLAGAIVRETLAKGGRHMRPLVATPSLAAAFVDPALARLGRGGAEIRLGRPLRDIRFGGDKVLGLTFDDGEETLRPQDPVILSVPPWIARTLLPGISAPDAFRAIVNAHFRLAPATGAETMVGLIGGTAEWVFAFHDRFSVTVSAADHLIDQETESLAQLLWRDVASVHELTGPIPPCRIVKERRATFAATPAQGRAASPRANRVDQPFPGRRLGRYRSAGNHRGRTALGRGCRFTCSRHERGSFMTNASSVDGIEDDIDR